MQFTSQLILRHPSLKILEIRQVFLRIFAWTGAKSTQNPGISDSGNTPYNDRRINLLQKLILPVNKCRLTASWKTAAYRVRFGFQHYGADIISTSADRTLWASGNGTVVSRGFDSVVGNVVAVSYPGAINHRSGKASDLILRYFHLESIAVQVGQAVNKDTRLGIYGRTGSMNMANHLHLEADTDTKHPLFSPTVNSSSYLRGRAFGANDKTMSSPLDWLHCKTDAPDYQAYSTAGDSFIAPADKTIPNLTGKIIGGGEDLTGGDGYSTCVCEALLMENENLKRELANMRKDQGVSTIG